MSWLILSGAIFSASTVHCSNRSCTEQLDNATRAKMGIPLVLALYHVAATSGTVPSLRYSVPPLNCTVTGFLFLVTAFTAEKQKPAPHLLFE